MTKLSLHVGDKGRPFAPQVVAPLAVSGGDCHTGAIPLTFFQQDPDAIHIEP